MVPGLSNRICSQDQSKHQSKICQNQPKTPKVNMLKSGDVSFDFGFEWCLGSATGYVAQISMLILATYPSANSPSWPPCPGMFGTLFGTFGTFGTSGTFGTFLDPRNNVPGQHRANDVRRRRQSVGHRNGHRLFPLVWGPPSLANTHSDT